MCEVDRILNAKSNWEIFLRNTEKSIDSSLIRKRFREMAVIVHPDKSSLPGAEAAFKRLYEAYEALMSASRNRMFEESVDSSNSAETNDRNDVRFSKKRHQNDDYTNTCKTNAYKESPNKTAKKKYSFEEFMRKWEAAEHEFILQNKASSKHLKKKMKKRTYNFDDNSDAHVEMTEEELVQIDENCSKWRSFVTSNSHPKASSVEANSLSSSSIVENVESKPIDSSLKFCCMLCRRAFPSSSSLMRHESESLLHKNNLALL
jgi:curved DNA-binding protein CbpA